MTVMQKLGTYFRIPQKMMRAALDTDAITENILRFPALSAVFDEDFFPIAGNFKASDIIVPKRFAKLPTYDTMMLAMADQVTMVLVPGASFWAFVPHRLVADKRGVGYYYLDFDLFTEPHALLLLNDYLRLRYPLPSSD